MSVPDGLKLVDAALQEFYCQSASAFHLPRPIKTLESDASKRASGTGTVFHDCAGSCGVEYGERHHEIVIWHISLMFAEYVAGMLEEKSRDGHCRSHPKPCALTYELHLRMLVRFKADLLKLVDEISAIEKNVAKGSPPSPSGSS